MCGICGIFAHDQGSLSESLLTEMTQTLRHRGPDDMGVEIVGRVGLGQTRLSIIDLTQAGHQPMFSDDGDLAIVYNGEIYNFLEIRSELEQSGVAFRGRSDTEVILEGLSALGGGDFPQTQRYVRRGDLGQADPNALPRPRSVRNQTAQLCAHRPGVDFRFRD